MRSLEKGRLPAEAKQVVNGFGKKEYGGPCPPWGTHRYIFTLYALDTEHLRDINRSSFFNEVKKHSLKKAELKGLYKRQ